MPIDELHDIVADWNRRRTEVARLPTDRAGDWRQRTVRYRRLLQSDIAKLAIAIRALDDSEATRADGRLFRAELSALRSCVAEHQATWPVVTIDPDDDEYNRSVVGLRAANDRFAKASSDILARLTRSGERRG